MSEVLANPFDEFPEQVREDVEGLLYLGYLEDEFEFCGHNFVVRTIRGDEELLAALVSKEYVDSLGQSKAWIWATISLALVAVDGDEGFCPAAGPDKKAFARARFQYCTSKWFWPTAQFIFARFSSLVERQAAAVQALQTFCKRDLPTSWPSADFSTDKGPSEAPEPPQEDITEFLAD